LKVLLAGGVFFAGYFVIQLLVKRVKQRILDNALYEDIYTQKLSELVGSIVFIGLIIFDVLAVFQVIGFDVALLM